MHVTRRYVGSPRPSTKLNCTHPIVCENWYCSQLAPNQAPTSQNRKSSARARLESSLAGDSRQLESSRVRIELARARVSSNRVEPGSSQAGADSSVFVPNRFVASRVNFCQQAGTCFKAATITRTQKRWKMSDKSVHNAV